MEGTVSAEEDVAAAVEEGIVVERAYDIPGMTEREVTEEITGAAGRMADERTGMELEASTDLVADRFAGRVLAVDRTACRCVDEEVTTDVAAGRIADRELAVDRTASPCMGEEVVEMMAVRVCTLDEEWTDDAGDDLGVLRAQFLVGLQISILENLSSLMEELPEVLRKDAGLNP